jgi:hypothetical protein
MRTEREQYELVGTVYPKDRRPPAKPAGKIILISDSAASPTIYPAYSDGSAWRKFSDGSVVS